MVPQCGARHGPVHCSFPALLLRGLCILPYSHLPGGGKPCRGASLQLALRIKREVAREEGRNHWGVDPNVYKNTASHIELRAQLFRPAQNFDTRLLLSPPASRHLPPHLATPSEFPPSPSHLPQPAICCCCIPAKINSILSHWFWVQSPRGYFSTGCSLRFPREVAITETYIEHALLSGGTFSLISGCKSLCPNPAPTTRPNSTETPQHSTAQRNRTSRLMCLPSHSSAQSSAKPSTGPGLRAYE